MDESTKAGWFPDPFGRHEERYFANGVATMLGRNGGQVINDELAGPSSATASDVVTDQSHPGDHAVEGHIVKAPVTLTTMMIVGVVLLAAAIGLPHALAKKKKAPTESLASYVVKSADKTLATDGAVMTISGSVSAHGISVPLSGLGQINFKANELNGFFQESAAGTPITIHEVFVNGSGYLEITADGFNPIRALEPGKQWVELPLNPSGSTALGSQTVDPLGQLQLLKNKGYDVKALGASEVVGQACTEYQVTVPKAVMEREVQSNLAQSGLTGTSLKQVQAYAEDVNDLVVDVWVDHSGLVRRTSTRLSGSNDLAGAVDVTITKFTGPVTISAPPAGQVVSLRNFLLAAQYVGGHAAA